MVKKKEALNDAFHGLSCGHRTKELIGYQFKSWQFVPVFAAAR